MSVCTCAAVAGAGDGGAGAVPPGQSHLRRAAGQTLARGSYAADTADDKGLFPY